MQLYLSALPFAPTRTALRQTYATEAESVIKVVAGMDAGWSLYLKLLKPATNTKSGRVTCMSFSPDGRHVASGTQDGTLEVYDTANETSAYCRREVKTPITAIAFSTDGAKLVAGSSKDVTIRVWDASNGDVLYTLASDKGTVWSVAFSPDNARIACGTSTGWLIVWDAMTTNLVAAVRAHDPSNEVRAIAFSPDGQHLASVSFSSARSWDLESNKRLNLLYGEGRQCRPTSVTFSRDGKDLIASWEDTTIRTWCLSPGSSLLPVISGESLPVEDATSWSLAPNGYRWACGRENGSIVTLDNNNRLVDIPAHTGPITALAFSSDGTLLVSGCENGSQKLWGDIDGEGHLVSEHHDGAVTSLDFSSDGKFVATGSKDTTIRIWDTGTGALVTILTGHTTEVSELHFCRDGQTLRSWSAEDDVVYVWDAETWSVITRDARRRTICDRSKDSRHDRDQEPLERHMFFLAPGNAERFLWRISSEAPDYSRDRLCLIPDFIDHRDDENAFMWQGNHVAFGCEDGRVVIMEVLQGGGQEQLHPTCGRLMYGARIALVTRFCCVPIVEKGLTWEDVAFPFDALRSLAQRRGSPEWS